MHIKIEQAFIWSGTIGLMLLVFVVYSHALMPQDFLEFLRGGNTGSVIVGMLFIVSMVGILCYLVNIIRGVRKYWHIRLGSCLIFFIAVGIVSALL